MELAGKIISLCIAALISIFIVIFFAKRKSPTLLCLYLTIFFVYLATHIIEWFDIKGLETAQQLMFLVCVFFCIACIIVYENDIKTLFARVRRLHLKTEQKNITDEEVRTSLKAIVSACQSLSKSRTGALIVIVREKIDNYIIESGVRLDAEISAPLLESIFNTKSPMHDGAVIIKDYRIVTAGSFLPLTKSLDVDKTLGTRHRAGIGVTESEVNDVISIIISEETGIISTVRKGILRRYLTPERLFDMLYDPLRDDIEKGKK